MSSPKKSIPGAAASAAAKSRSQASAKTAAKPVARTLKPADYLKKILTARVYDVAVESALEPARNLSLRLNNTVLLKREDQQPVFSFKLRGAYNKMAHLTPAQLKK
ncbi:MAG: L-threonine ammonia-lyase, partial [Polaromonas sp.]|nr:L-threonine ammonia-lyase [Polaromonas sp.]